MLIPSAVQTGKKQVTRNRNQHQRVQKVSAPGQTQSQLRVQSSNSAFLTRVVTTIFLRVQFHIGCHKNIFHLSIDWLGLGQSKSLLGCLEHPLKKLIVKDGCANQISRHHSPQSARGAYNHIHQIPTFESSAARLAMRHRSHVWQSMGFGPAPLLAGCNGIIDCGLP